VIDSDHQIHNRQSSRPDCGVPATGLTGAAGLRASTPSTQKLYGVDHMIHSQPTIGPNSGPTWKLLAVLALGIVLMQQLPPEPKALQTVVALGVVALFLRVSGQWQEPNQSATPRGQTPSGSDSNAQTGKGLLTSNDALRNADR
jgi:hypothetical protein